MVALHLVRTPAPPIETSEERRGAHVPTSKGEGYGKGYWCVPLRSTLTQLGGGRHRSEFLRGLLTGRLYVNARNGSASSFFRASSLFALLIN